jgi:hypothetical protein
VEGIAKSWIDLPASLGIFSAEGGQFLGGYGMLPDRKLKTAATMSELWDGRGMRPLRAADGLTNLFGRRFSLHLMIQAKIQFFVIKEFYLELQLRIPKALPGIVHIRNRIQTTI